MQKKLWYNCIAIIGVMICLITSFFSYAWYTGRENSSVNLNGSSAGSYFAGGDGSSDNPFEINNARHMYNLAWLQSRGKLQNDENGYYFKVTASFSMIINDKKVIIPPIGNDEYPFIGNFNGGGYTISDLVVSTDINKIYNGNFLGSSYKFSNAVGLFGMTAKSTISNIRNFILNDPTVEATSTFTTGNSATSKRTIGLAIGYVTKTASSIGVLKGKMSVSSTSYSTYNSILGGLADDVESKVTGGGSNVVQSGGDTGHFNADLIYNKMTGNEIAPSNNSYMLESKRWYVSENTVLNPSESSNYWGLGCFSFLTSSGATQVRPFTGNKSLLYLADNISNDDKTYSLSENVKTLDVSNDLNSQNEYYKYLKTDTEHKSQILNGIYFNNSPDATDLSVYSENGTELSPNVNSGTNKMRNSHIKVNIVKDNTKMFVVFSNPNDKEERYLGITKVGTKDDIIGLSNSRFYFKNNYSSLLNVVSQIEYDRSSPTYQISSGIGANRLIAAIVDIKEAGFYNIASTKSGLIIHYLAVEGVEDGDTNTGEVLGDGDGVSAVDFIYDGVSITQEKINDVAAFNFVVGNVFYQKSGTSIYFTNTSGIITLFFDRKSALSFIVKYNGIKPTASYLSKVTIEETTDTVIT